MDEREITEASKTNFIVIASPMHKRFISAHTNKELLADYSHSNIHRKHYSPLDAIHCCNSNIHVLSTKDRNTLHFLFTIDLGKYFQKFVSFLNLKAAYWSH